MALYRVNANIGSLRHGEIVDVDDTLDYWQSKIAAGYLTPHAPVTGDDPEVDAMLERSTPTEEPEPLVMSSERPRPWYQTRTGQPGA